MSSKPRKYITIVLMLTVVTLFSLLLVTPQPVFAQPEDEPAAMGRPTEDRQDQENGPRKQMRRRMMERARDGGPGDQDGREGKMKRLGNFISFMSTFLASVKDPHQAAGLAALSIKDVYKKQGKPLEAVKILEDAIGSSKDQAMRNVLLFSLRQIYEENNQTDKVLEVSQRILKENVAAKQ